VAYHQWSRGAFHGSALCIFEIQLCNIADLNIVTSSGGLWVVVGIVWDQTGALVTTSPLAGAFVRPNQAKYTASFRRLCFCLVWLRGRLYVRGKLGGGGSYQLRLYDWSVLIVPSLIAQKQDSLSPIFLVTFSVFRRKKNKSFVFMCCGSSVCLYTLFIYAELLNVSILPSRRTQPGSRSLQRRPSSWARHRHFHFLSHTNDQKLDFWFGYFITVLRISFLPSLLKSRSIAAITLAKLELPVRKNGPCVFPVSSSFPLTCRRPTYLA